MCTGYRNAFTLTYLLDLLNGGAKDTRADLAAFRPGNREMESLLDVDVVGAIDPIKCPACILEHLHQTSSSTREPSHSEYTLTSGYVNALKLMSHSP